MIKKIIYSLTFLLFTTLIFVGCSDDEKDDTVESTSYTGPGSFWSATFTPTAFKHVIGKGGDAATHEPRMSSVSAFFRSNDIYR